MLFCVILLLSLTDRGLWLLTQEDLNILEHLTCFIEKCIGYNLNVMRKSACLVFNPIMVDNYAAFFNCTPVGRASDSMMAPT